MDERLAAAARDLDVLLGRLPAGVEVDRILRMDFYPATDTEGYYAYAACSYYAPRLDEGKSHEEALDVALEQLLRRKKLRGPFPEEEVEKLAYRALGVWKKWKTLKLEEKIAEEKQKTADTTQTALEAAREQRVAAEILHRTVNGREGDEDFDTTK